uniref:Uncharacterized protein n=1 Tax=Magallana gigas TaxID=29159 RepID=K1R765_MAGGI
MAAPQPTVVIQQPKRERFADKILLNLIISFFFPFWLFVWCCMGKKDWSKMLFYKGKQSSMLC